MNEIICLITVSWDGVAGKEGERGEDVGSDVYESFCSCF
jgi:hypothetical protein